MAEVAVVYDAAPVPRTTADVINPDRADAAAARRRGPVAQDTWLTASVTAELAEVVAAGFDEACRRDPHRKRTWVVLVDANRAQIKAIKAQAKRCHARVHIVELPSPQGQARGVRVHRLPAKDTVDQRVLEIPDYKSALIEAYAHESEAEKAHPSAMDAVTSNANATAPSPH